MTTEHIESVFKDYLESENTNYAILLNGSWGSGKTHFWKNKLVPIAKSLEQKHIYISLNGINKLDALEHALFTKLIPFIGEKEDSKSKTAMTVLTNTVNHLSKTFLKTSLADIFKGVSVDTFDFTSYVICFDDLERCQMPVKEVLGFINNFVEHKSMKTLILADETKLDSSQSAYDGIKEKVVGRVLNFKMNIAETMPFLFTQYKTNKDFYEYLEKHRHYFTEVLLEYKQDNLRIISFYLSVLHRLFPEIKNINESYNKEFLLLSAIITIEFKRGNLKSSDSENYKDLEIIDENFYHRISSPLMKEAKTDGADKSYSVTVYETYLSKRISDYYFYKSVYSFILSGYLDVEQLRTEITNRPPENPSKEIVAFRQVINYKFRELDDSDFAVLNREVLQYAKEGKYSLYDFVSIAQFYYFFSENKLIPEDIETLNEIFDKGLYIAKQRKETNDYMLENLLHFGSTPLVTAMKQKVKEIHIEIKKELDIKRTETFLDILTNGDEYKLAEYFKKYLFRPELFGYLDGVVLFETLIRCSNKQVFNFTELLKERYNVDKAGEFLFIESVCLISLQGSLGSYLDGHKELAQPRLFLLATLETELLIIIDHLSATKKL